MHNRQFSLPASLLFLLYVLIFIAMLWMNGRFPFVQIGGDHFIARWMGTRLFLIEGQSPYSIDTAKETQRFVYGHKARQGEDPQYFLYPFYSFLLFSPLAVINQYAVARSVWMAILLFALFGCIVGSLLITHWRIKGSMLAAVLLFSVTWYPAIRAVMAGNVVVLVSTFLLAALLAIRTNHDGLASICLVLACVKPNTVALVILLIMIWAISQRRWTLVGGFLASFALIVTATTLFLPGWLVEIVKQWVSFLDLVQVGTPAALFVQRIPAVGVQMGWVLTVIIGVMLAWEWSLVLQKDFQWLFWTTCLTLAAGSLIGIPTSTDNYVLIYPAVILMLSTWRERWGKIGLGMTFVSLFILFFGLWGLFLRNAWRGVGTDYDILYFFLLPLFTIFGLYWVRLWAIRPSRLPIETLAEVVS